MLVGIVHFIIDAGDVYTGPVDEGVAGDASAGIVLREICLVGGASLANVLNDGQTGQAFADSVYEVLVKAAGVLANTLIKHGVVEVAFGALTAVAVDGEVTLFAIAVEGVNVEDFVGAAAVAHGFVASVDFDWDGLAAGAVIVVPAVAVVV